MTNLEMIDEARARLGWNDARLARFLDVRDQSIVGWRAGKSEPRAVYAIAARAAAGMAIDDFVSGSAIEYKIGKESAAYKEKIERLRECASSGMTRKQAAERMAISYTYVCELAAKTGITLRKNVLKLDANREAEILAMFEAGEKLETIGGKFGITRERIRQIAKRSGAVTRHELSAQRQEFVLSAARLSLTQEEFIEAIKPISKANAQAILHKHGVRLPKTRAWFKRKAELDALIDEYEKSGKSLLAVCGGRSSLQNTVINHMRARGIEWKKRPRASRQEMQERKAAKEKKQNLKGRLDQYNKRQSLVAKRAPQLVKEAEPIQFFDTVKETAIANYGKVSASVIADAMHVSRNTIIGHWFRARKNGEIAA